MLFEARDLKSYAQPVSASELRMGSIYFFVNFIDDEMLLPTLNPVVFVGEDLEPEDSGQVYFQDADSFLEGTRYDNVTEENPATFFMGSRDEVGHVFQYERALEVLMRCSLRRRKFESRAPVE